MGSAGPSVLAAVHQPAAVEIHDRREVRLAHRPLNVKDASLPLVRVSLRKAVRQFLMRKRKNTLVKVLFIF